MSFNPDEQDAIAADESWERSFRENPERLRSLALEALEEHRRGETRPLDECA